MAAAGLHRLLGQGRDHSRLDARRQVRRPRAGLRGPEPLRLPQRGGLQAAEGEVQGVAEVSDGHGDGRRGLTRRALDGRAAWVAQSEEPRDLVEGLARGVIPRLTDEARVQPVPDEEQVRVAARDDQGHEGRLGTVSRAIAGEPAAEGVGVDVVHADDGQAPRPRIGLGGHEAHHQGADEPRAAGHGDAIEGGAIHPGVIESLGDDRVDQLEMPPGGDLGHHPTIARVEIDLAADDAGEDAVAVLNDGCRRLVAGGLYAQHPHQWPASRVMRIRRRRCRTSAARRSGRIIDTASSPVSV